MAKLLTALDMRVVEAVLQMESGYVLDFNDRTFAEFFDDLGVNINDAEYCEDGTSKAKRLRCFLRSSDATLVSRALSALLDHRLVCSGVSLRDQDRAAYLAIRDRISVPPNPSTPSTSSEPLARRTFDPAAFSALPFDSKLNAVLCARMAEAQKCERAGAYLSCTILLGSVLEGMCEGFVLRYTSEIQAAHQARHGTQAARLDKMPLAGWLKLLCELGYLSRNIEHFGHGLREFRNYVHPGAELRNDFAVNEDTAAIGLQVVMAAVNDLTRASKNQSNG